MNPRNTFRTPFEVQVVVNSVNAQGITVLVSTTSGTQVHSLFVSYVAFDPSIPNAQVGSLVYDKYVGLTTVSKKLEFDASSSALSFFGINGFIIGNTGAPFSLAISYDAQTNSGVAQSGSSIYYLSANSFFFLNGPCGYCTGFSINYNGTCVASCPPSSYYNGVTCVTCSAGQTWNGTSCVAVPVTPTTPTTPTNPITPTNPTTPVAITCPVGTYWDGQQLRCLPCLNGCASCVDCYSCSTCSLGYFFKSGEPLCSEICGDGRKFVLACDDGNTINGDGCSSSCQVEAGFVCTGGSPTSKDSCLKGLPSAIEFTASGQSRVWGKIIVNVKSNYLPQALLDSAVDCHNKCNNVLSAKIISGDSSAVSILASYIPNTSFSFSIEVNFAKEPIGMFVLQVGINPSLIPKYFAGINASSTININVNPAFFNTAQSSDNLTR